MNSGNLASASTLLKPTPHCFLKHYFRDTLCFKSWLCHFLVMWAGTSGPTSISFVLLDKLTGPCTGRAAQRFSTPACESPVVGTASASMLRSFVFLKQRRFQMWAEPSSPRPRLRPGMQGEGLPQPVIAINRDLKHRLLKIRGWSRIKALPAAVPDISPSSSQTCRTEPA